MPDHAIAANHKYPCTHEIPFSLYMLPTPVYPNWGACDNRKTQGQGKGIRRQSHPITGTQKFISNDHNTFCYINIPYPW